jgi:hypothetical protein
MGYGFQGQGHFTITSDAVAWHRDGLEGGQDWVNRLLFELAS